MTREKRRMGQCLSCWLVLQLLACEDVDAHLGANDKGVVEQGGAGGSSGQNTPGAAVAGSIAQPTPGGASAGGAIQTTSASPAAGSAAQLTSAGASAGGTAQTTVGGTAQTTTAGASGAQGFLGAWQEQGSQSGYQSYLIIENERGFFCCDDGKSEATFTYELGNDGQLTLGSYGYGSGDTLSLVSNGAALQRISVEKGVTFTIAYVDVVAIPAWCQQQIDTMRKSL